MLAWALPIALSGDLPAIAAASPKDRAACFAPGCPPTGGSGYIYCPHGRGIPSDAMSTAGTAVGVSAVVPGGLVVLLAALLS